jgi:anti-anti-sigma regulatory factor
MTQPATGVVSVGIVLSQETDSSMICIDEAADIAVASELKAALLLALEAGKGIRVSLNAVTDMDVAVYQLLWMAQRQAQQAGTEFSIADPPPLPVKSALAEMGLDGLFGE